MLTTLKLHVGKMKSFWQMVLTHGLDMEEAFARYLMLLSKVLIFFFFYNPLEFLRQKTLTHAIYIQYVCLYLGFGVFKAQGSLIKRRGSLIRSLNLIGLLITEGA